MDDSKKMLHLQSSQHRLLIKNGLVVNHDESKFVDVYIEESIIKQVGNHLIIPGGTRVIDAVGKLILPGGIDPNVHFQSPIQTPGTSVPNGTRTIDDFYSGTKAALKGGTTTIIDLIKPDSDESLLKAFEKWQLWAEGEACCDFAFKLKIPCGGLTNQMTDEMRELTMENYGINCFQASMADLNDQDLMEFLDRCTNLGCVAQVDAENAELVKRNENKLINHGITGPEGFALSHTEEAEEEANLRACTMAHNMNCPLYLTHVSSMGTLDIIKTKKAKDHVVFGEISPACLACDGQGYWNQDWNSAAALVQSPPLRKGQLEDLATSTGQDDHGIDLVGSNHAAFNARQKALGLKDFTKIPLGVNGVEERMSVIWNQAVTPGHMTKERFVAVTSANAAKIFGLYPDKGYIDVGSQADIVIWDPEASITIDSKNHLSKSDLNIFEGMTFQGKPETVILRGRIMVDDSNVKAVQGFGRYLPLSPYPIHVYEKIKSRSSSLLEYHPVIRNEEDLEVNGGDIPPPATAKSVQPEKAPSQQISSIDLKSHPNSPDPPPVMTRTKHRSSIKIKNPPGGRTSGSFW